MAEEVKKLSPDDVEVVAHAKMAKPAEKSMWEKFVDVFHLDWDYISNDIIVPGVMNLASDVLHSSIDRVFDRYDYYDNPRSRRHKRSRYIEDDYYEYGDYYGSGHSKRRGRSIWDDDDYYERRHKRGSGRSDDFRVIEDMSREEVNMVLNKIKAWLRDYDAVSVAKIKYWSGLGDKVIGTDHNWGWYGLEDIHRINRGGSYGLEFEPPEPLD